MAKVQAKKASASAKKSAAKSKAARPVSKPAKKAPAKQSKPAKPVKKAKPAKSSKPAPKAAKPSKPQKVTKPAKPVKAAKPSKPAKAPATKGTVGKTVAKAAKAVAKVAAAAVPAAAKAVHAVAAVVDEKKRRRSRTRVQSSGTPVANWFVQEKPRPSSFIPAPPRAEAPSLVAAPPASSDRLIRPEDLTHSAVRTVPVRVDIEQGAGRVFLSVSPMEVTLRPNEGIEWDFRYLGGADVIVDEVLIEFDRPSPFGNASFRSKRPGAARPHRQLSGGASNNAAGKRFQYTIRAMTAFKTDLATSRPSVHILLA